MSNIELPITIYEEDFDKAMEQAIKSEMEDVKDDKDAFMGALLGSMAGMLYIKRMKKILFKKED